MTAQEAYERIFEYFTRPGAKIADNCEYISEDGSRCAVGCLIPKNLLHVNAEWNSSSIRSLHEYASGRTVLEFLGAERDDYGQNNELFSFLDSAQYRHDESETVEEFLDKLDKLALKFNLNPPFKNSKPTQEREVAYA